MAFDNFTNNQTKIKFYSGLQANLTTKITTGGAEEGAFYLTTDTQRLYVGRKVTGSDPAVIKAVQVSKGVTFVASSGDLPTPTSADVEEGELYYITSSNVLAALVYENSTYKWVQINPPTGITTIEGNAVASGNNVILNNIITTGAGEKLGMTKFVAGSNVTLTAGGYENITDPNNNGSTIQAGKITIAATDTTYTLGTEATASGSTDGATVELCINGNASNASNTKVNITGDGTVAVTSDANGNIAIHGPSFTGISAEGKVYNANASNPAATRGMTLSLNGTDGDGAALDVSGSFDPIIEYGQSGSKSAAHFQKVTRSSTDYIIADLDVYTKAQADTAIGNAIASQLATANAMTYKGVVTSLSDLRSQIVANGGAHNGDVYKAGNITSGNEFQINGIYVDIGDLIIITGTEATTGQYAGQILVGSPAGPITSSTAYSLIVGSENNGTITPGICELIPSGDEPELTASVNNLGSGSTELAAPNIALYDGKNSGSDSTTNILTTRFLSGNLITVSGAATSNTNKKSTGQDLALTVSHNTVTRTNSTTEALQNNGTANAVLTKAASGASDTIANDTYELFVFSDPSKALVTDNYGHVTALKGKKINFKHNKITSYTTTYGVSSANGQITIESQDLISTSPLAASFKIKSNTLTLLGDNTSGSEGLNIDLTLGTF